MRKYITILLAVAASFLFFVFEFGTLAVAAGAFLVLALLVGAAASIIALTSTAKEAMALTLPPTFPARNDGRQHSHFIRKRFTVADASAMNAGLKICRLPSRAFIGSVMLYKTTAFNSGTSDNLTIGTTATGNDILAATVLTGTGFVAATSAAGLGIVVGTTGEVDLFMRWVAVGTAATTGDVTVVVSFIPDNDQ